MSLQTKEAILVFNISKFIGGAEISLQQNIRHISKSKFYFVIALSTNDAIYNTLKSESNVLLLEKKIRYYEQPGLTKKLYTILKLLSLSFTAIKHINKTKIQHIYCNSYRSLPYIYIISVFTGKRFLFHCRDNIKRKFLFKFLLHKASFVISVSKFINAQVPISPNKKHVVYNSIDPQLWKTNLYRRENTRKLLGATQKTILIGSVGQFVSWKNHEDFLHLAKEILSLKSSQHVRFILVGHLADTAYVKKLQNIIKSDNLEKDVSILGFKVNIKEYIEAMDIVVHCALKEPFGRILIESMALNKLVVAYDSGAASEIIFHNLNGFLVKERDISSLYSSVRNLIENFPEKSLISSVTRDFVHKEFNIKNKAIEIENLISRHATRSDSID